jgi:hypothetical protein
MTAEDEPPRRTAVPGTPDDRSDATPPATGTGERGDDEERFAADLVVRGEVVPEGTEVLPPGTTHEVVAEEDGVPTRVRRRRFSASG